MWFWFAIGAAGVSSISVLLNKRLLGRVNAYLLSWSLFALSLPLLIVLSILNKGVPLGPLFFVGALGSGTVFVFAKTIDLQSIKKSVLSRVFPLAVFSTFFNYFLGLIILGEKIKLIPLVGGLLIVVGAYMMNVEKAKENIFEPIKTLFTDRISAIYLFAMLLSAFSALFDKVGVTHTQPISPYLTLLVENALSTVFLTGYMIRNDKNWISDLKKYFIPLTICSIVYVFVGILMLTAFSKGPIALVSAAKRTEIILTLLLSTIFLQDKPPRHIWIAAVIMLLGVVLIRLT